MSANGNLDRTLDSIVKDRKPARRNKPRRAAAPAAGKSAVAASKAPSNGIQKNKAVKPGKAVVVPLKRTGDSKIQVSGLPEDVSEAMLKDYLREAVGPVKSVLLNYGPNGRSRGSATVTFPDPTSATRALELDGVKVDNRTLKVEVLAGSNILSQVPIKTLSDRISKPKIAAKEKPKPAADNKKGAANGKGAATGKTAGKTDAKKEGGRKGRAGRPKAKTVDELDAEMADYFGGAPAANGSAQPAAAPTAADTAMDEVL